jgi:uncharacterized delta-60 repeat protein
MDLQADGKIVLGGYGKVGTQFDFAIVRLNANGTADASFGNQGVATCNMGGDAFILAMALQADNKIVVAGVVHNGSNYDIAIARFDPDKPSSIPTIAKPGISATLYPNPGTGAVHLDYDLESEGFVTVRLLDMQGKVITIFTDHIMLGEGRQQSVLDIPGGLSPGLYIIDISTQNTSVSLKMMVSGNTCMK